MKHLFSLLFVVAIVPFLISLQITALAQSPTVSPNVSPTASATGGQGAVSPSNPTPAVGNADRPNLPFWVEILACAVMIGSVLSVFLLVWRQQEINGLTIGPRHIQFVSVCLIVPTILILGLEQWLSRETTATLIGGLTGYLLSGLGKYEPPNRRDGGGDKTKTPDSTSGGTPTTSSSTEDPKRKHVQSAEPALAVPSRYANGHSVASRYANGQAAVSEDET